VSNDIRIGDDGFYHPINEEQVIALVQRARSQHLQIRVRGSAHSVAAAIYTDNFQKGMIGLSGINILLDQMRKVTFLEPEPGVKDSILVKAEAGCNLGQDPHDPSASSTWSNSLFAQINERGWAFPDTGGIIHQTVAGFTSTGSSGGSVKHSVGRAIEVIDFIDGTGRRQSVSRKENPDIFSAMGVSLGLLGIITAVTFRCVERFAIQGTEVITTAADCSIDLFGDGDTTKRGLEEFLRETEYTRLMWWPQAGVDKMVVWSAKRIPFDPEMKRKPYKEIGTRCDEHPILSLLTDIVGQSLGHAFFKLVGTWPQWLYNLLANEQVRQSFLARCKEMGEKDLQTVHRVSQAFQPPSFVLQELSNSNAVTVPPELNGVGNGANGSLLELLKNLEVALEFMSKLYRIDLFRNLVQKYVDKVVGMLLSPIINMFVKEGTQEFQDYWYCALPMDNQISDELMPTEFTELWIPLSCTQDVMVALRDYYRSGGLAATGTYCCEIYAAGKSEFWLSPSFEQDMVRVDIFWYAYNRKSPAVAFFPQFWRLLEQFNFRPHWGKYLPAPDSSTGVHYLRRQYPKWGDFMDLRMKLDPDQLFVSDYWRQHLGIPAVARVEEKSQPTAA